MHFLQEQQHLSGLNEQQRDAVLCPADILFVSAGPGTGKTHLLTSKLVNYIVTSDITQKIVALSYTNTAARQIGERFEKKAIQLGLSDDFSFYNGTIHSFCYKMMKSFGDTFDYTILDDEELIELASDIIAQTPEELTQSTVMKCLRSDPKEADSPLYKAISHIKEQLKVISIQDILSMFLQLLETNPEFQDWLRDQVTVMAVDEAQDLTELNYLILDQMLKVIPDLKVFLVGDPRQNIFEFNGGSYKNLDDFLSRHPNHEMKTLTVTYRCGQPISDFVNTFHFDDCENYSLQPVSKAGQIVVLDSTSEMEEAERVKTAVLNTGNISQCAVLSNNLRYLGPFIKLLRCGGIPYKVFGGQKVLKRHIRFLNHILRIIDSDNAYSIRKIAQYAGIDIVRDGKKRKSAFYESDLGQVIQSIRNESSFTRIADRVICEIMAGPDDDAEIAADYNAFLDMASQFGTISDYLAAFATDRDRFTPFYLTDIAECQVPTDEGFLTISTIHSAKGLEWDTVFIMGLCEGNFPNPYYCQNLTPFEQQEFFNNEWKRMYVAATRARRNLYLTFSTQIKRKGYTFHKAPSRFLQAAT